MFRISNTKAEGLVQTNRVQNEAAAMHLASRSVVEIQGTTTPIVIPAIYDWQSAGDDMGMGWILMEFMPGIPLDQHFADLSESQKREIVNQLARIFAAIQRASLPESISSYGGLDISDDGQIISGAMTTLSGGPWPTFIDFLRTKLSAELREADESSVLQGWRENGVRQQIDNFLEMGIVKCVSEFGIDKNSRVLLHSDLSKCAFALLASKTKYPAQRTAISCSIRLRIRSLA